MNLPERLQSRFYSDIKYDGTTAFYDLIEARIGRESRILNLGAGPATPNPQCRFKGRVAEVVGADVDEAVLANDGLDTAVVINGVTLPFETASFDVVYSDFVLEHVEKPEALLTEVCRVLKPGCEFLFRTPNLYHYVTLISRLTPQSFHEAVANRARLMSDDEHKPWPTYYRANTRRAINRLAAKSGFSATALRMIEPNPSYMMFSIPSFAVGLAYERLVNSTELLRGFRANIIGTLRK